MTDQSCCASLVFHQSLHPGLAWFHSLGSLSICSDLDEVKGLTVPYGSKLTTTNTWLVFCFVYSVYYCMFRIILFASIDYQQMLISLLAIDVQL